jgi:hypothetical protein
MLLILAKTFFVKLLKEAEDVTAYLSEHFIPKYYSTSSRIRSLILVIHQVCLFLTVGSTCISRAKGIGQESFVYIGFTL